MMKSIVAVFVAAAMSAASASAQISDARQRSVPPGVTAGDGASGDGPAGETQTTLPEQDASPEGTWEQPGSTEGKKGADPIR